MLLVGALPARSRTRIIHNVMAQVMCTGMLGLAVLFACSAAGLYRWLEIASVLCMAVFGGLTFLDKPRFIMYELAFIFTSHGSIILAALALRGLN